MGVTRTSHHGLNSCCDPRRDKRDEAGALRKRFLSSEGDHLTLLAVYRAYTAVPRKEQVLKIFLGIQMMQCCSAHVEWLACGKLKSIPHEYFSTCVASRLIPCLAGALVPRQLCQRAVPTQGGRHRLAAAWPPHRPGRCN